jgi:hypothetical protein
MTNRASFDPHATGPLRSLAGTRLQHYRGAVPCGFLHPGKGCSRHAATFFPAAYLRALPVYLPGTRWEAVDTTCCGG